MSNYVRDEGPLPEEALRNLSYINGLSNRVGELEQALEQIETMHRPWVGTGGSEGHATWGTLEKAAAIARAALKGERENA